MIVYLSHTSFHSNTDGYAMAVRTADHEHVLLSFHYAPLNRTVLLAPSGKTNKPRAGNDVSTREQTEDTSSIFD